jgi:hypothetical protein
MIQEILLPFVFFFVCDGLVKFKDWVMIVGIKLAKLGHVLRGKIEFSENLM